jgi:hypothetical protein
MFNIRVSKQNALYLSAMEMVTANFKVVSAVS